MAELAEPVVSFLLENITKLLKEEAQFLGGVSEQAEQLQSKMRLMLSLLRDADSRQDEDAVIREWISQSKIVAYDAENALEAFAFKVASRRGKGIANFLKRYACILSECYMRHRVGSEIQKLHSRISDLTRSFHEYGIRNIMEREGPSSRQQQLMRRTYSHVEEDFVGLEDDVKLLVQHLTNEHEVSPHSVVSISGMGGIGKTTIARKIYNHPNVRQHFDAFAWVCISQQWQTKDVLQGILVKIIPENAEQILKQWTEDQLVRHLYEIQQSKRCLIVLDDIWSADAWECIRNAFPTTETPVSKILLTTRNKNVAIYIRPDGFHHEPRLLSHDESWELLQKKALRGRHSNDHGLDDIHRFEELGKEMVKCCGGLPLAVVVVGGILATKHELNEWKFVYQNIKSYLAKGENIGGEGEFQRILALSYRDLPYQLKPCFLYLSIYPEDYDIETETLYQLWMAEGMVSEEDQIGDESMMDVAERYLGELAMRCMIQVSLKEGPTLRKFQSCRLHDLMRDMCLAKARNENFIEIVDYREENNPKIVDSNCSRSKCHRMAIFLNEEDVSKCVPPKREMIKHVRSLTFRRLGGGDWDGLMSLAFRRLGGGDCDGLMASTKFNNFKMLRALTVQGMDLSVPDKLYDAIRKLIQVSKLEIGDLIHLRYVCLKESIFLMLPSSLGNLEHLETLDLRDSEIMIIRNVLWKMKNLRHLYLPSTLHRRPRICGKLRLLGLSKLETLENLDSSGCEIKDLHKLSNIQVLKTLPIILKENECEEIINFISDSQSLKEASVLLYTDEEFCSSEKWLALVEKLFGSNLCHLSLRGLLRVMPEYKTHFFQNLVELELRGSRIEINLMGTLEKLPSLQSLWLGFDAIVGEEIICSSTGFPQLRFLLLDDLPLLREWRVESGALPNLSCLKIVSCENLEKIPDGLGFVTKLKELEIREMPKRFCERIRKTPEGEEGEDFHKICHVPSIVISEKIREEYDEG